MTQSDLTRRQFFGVTLLGLARKSGREIGGGFVHDSVGIGHRLRDGGRFPTPQQTRKVPVVIVGGGIAGLSAAWRLQKRGAEFVVLEMEETAGGNARSGRNDATAFPWAAHYVPVPGPRATLVRELFEDLAVLNGGVWDERHLCQAPQERLFLHGRWQEGLDPQVGPSARDRDQIARFDAIVEAARATGEFTIPMALGAKPSPLDGRSMGDWLTDQRLDSPWLRWSIDYACRDDYGARAAITSAWAGLHYFASRERHETGPLTWPEGNGWITARLLERIGQSVHTGQVVYRIARSGRRWSVLTPDTAWIADAVIFAAPSFLASRVVEHGPATPDFEVLAVADGECVARSMAERARRSARLGQRDLRVAVARLRDRDASVGAHVHSQNRLDVLLGPRPGHAPDESGVAPGAGLADAARSCAR